LSNFKLTSKNYFKELLFLIVFWWRWRESNSRVTYQSI